MKKFLTMLLCFALTLSLCAFAGGEAADLSGVKVSCPGGAPALALATLAAEHPEQYTFVAADTITAEFANATADFIIAPLNAGAKLYKAGKSTYKLGGVVAWGNLYFASQKEDFKPEDMNGAAVTLFGENTINASIALYALEQNGIVPETVNYLASAAETQSLLLTDAEAIVLTAEPALTAARMKNDKIGSCALNDLYKAATGRDGYAQAALFVNAETLEKDPQLVAAFLEAAAAAAERCTSDVEAVAEAAAALEILPNAKVAAAAIPHCAIRFVGAQEAREQIEETASVDLSQFGGELPADDFYYGAE